MPVEIVSSFGAHGMTAILRASVWSAQDWDPSNANVRAYTWRANKLWSFAIGVGEGLQLLHSSRAQLSSNVLSGQADVLMRALCAPQRLLGQL